MGIQSFPKYELQGSTVPNYAFALDDSAQSIPNTTWTTVSSWTNTTDPWGLESSGVFTCPKSGFWSFTITANWVGSATGGRYIGIIKNGAGAAYDFRDATGSPRHMGTGWMGYLSAGDTVEMQVYQDSGAAVVLGGAQSSFSGNYVGTGIVEPYYGDGTFLNEAARDAAILTPTEGQRAYLTAPTVPAQTGDDNPDLPSGVTTIYNGSVWVCTTPVGARTLSLSGGSTSSTSFTTTLTGGGTNPSVTLVTGTTALLHQTCFAVNDGGGTSVMAVGVSGATTIAASNDFALYFYGGNYQSGTFSLIVPGLTAGTNTFTLYYLAASGTCTYLRRSITVQGVA